MKAKSTQPPSESHQAPFQVSAINQEPASNRVVSQVLGMVRAGSLKAGDRLPSERELAEMFQVSRPTVREALRALVALGVLKTRHGSGIFVSPLQAADILGPLTFFLSLQDVQVDRLYEARRLIEGEIAGLAADRRTESQVIDLRELIAEQDRVVSDPYAYRSVDTRFHHKLAEIAGNPFLARAAESLNILGLEFRKVASETPAIITQSICDHRNVVECVAARDTGGARIGMQAHMMNVLRTTKQALAWEDRAHSRSGEGPGR
jgi:GntR family transcriptional regulator, transcriptional repressor for pyruvate dehydrogenase complex